MRDTPSTSRRRLLSGLASVTGIGLLAGCSGGSEGSGGDGGSTSGSGDASDTGDRTSDASDGGSSTAVPEASDDSGSTSNETESALDLREANVVDVAFEADGGRYTFDVSLHHDDDGEDGYANWWQVERLDGTRLGRRELLHAHSRQPFTRSETVEIPSEVTCVAVRGHDRTHGYGGRMMLVNVESGATQAVEQGADRRPVDERDCP
ncbi:hypothetical protein [Halobellus litoreus]|uniref:Lipoprotein n=1 Tax=Halobellus litoreus TaxID=755310 RepID=A0ABD6DSA0_9EURY|nr:hypothetical protein [Halobellus litoreus]